MNSCWTRSLAAVLLMGAGLAGEAATITFIGTGTVAGNALDFSGLTGPVSGTAGTITHNLLGAFGSGIAYTGSKNLYVMVNDRGYSDGITTPSYFDRLHLFTMTADPAAKTVTATLVDTRLLTDEKGQNLLGRTSEFNVSVPELTARFDPEGVRVARNGTVFISDEYGPYLYQFDQSGKRIRTIPVPAHYLIARPNGDGALEISGNTMGRQSNRGMEGLAISPDGTTLFGMMQNSLLQDGALNSAGSRRGVNTRILKIDIASGATQEFVYQLANGADNGVNEILAINDHEFLVIERDGRIGTAAVTKKIYRIDITGASDVSSRGTTVANGLPQTGDLNLTPVKKSLFLDLLDPAYGLAGASFPEKLEGLAWGPDLADGSRLLLVTSDNDLMAANPTRIYAFAVSADNFSVFQPQVIDAPFSNIRQSQIVFTAPLPAFNARSRVTEVPVTFTNTGAAITGPLNVAFMDLPSEVTLAEKAGTIGGQPYLTISSGNFGAGAQVTLNVRFTNSANRGIELKPIYYSGTL